jgi:hypothetical protein
MSTEQARKDKERLENAMLSMAKVPEEASELKVPDFWSKRKVTPEFIEELRTQISMANAMQNMIQNDEEYQIYIGPPPAGHTKAQLNSDLLHKMVGKFTSLYFANPLLFYEALAGNLYKDDCGRLLDALSSGSTLDEVEARLYEWNQSVLAKL